MPYQPGLIPTEHRVLPEYFTDKPVKGKPGNQPAGPVWAIIAAVIFFIVAVVNVGHIGISLLFAVDGFICTAWGKRKLEQSLRFTMTTKIRLVVCGLLLLSCLPLQSYYTAADVEDARQAELRHQHALRFTADSLKKDAVRKDSLQYFLTQSQKVLPEKALNDLKVAERFAVLADEKAAVDSAVKSTTFKLITGMLGSGKYKLGLSATQGFIRDHGSSPEMFYTRALCYIKLDSIQLAVTDLDSAKTAGFKPADKLYEKVNPLRRHIAYYETLCNDGTSSDATGRGACSWHGGVAEWNHPVYETSRKY